MTIGITEKQQQIYTTLLEYGIISASELAHFTGIRRTTLYPNLQKLQEMGLVTEITNQNKKYFQAVNPRSLKKIIRDKMGELKKIEENIPQFIEQYRSLKKGV